MTHLAKSSIDKRKEFTQLIGFQRFFGKSQVGDCVVNE
jgi:hypothetical protein